MNKKIYTFLASALVCIGINAQSVGFKNESENRNTPYIFPSDGASLDTYFTQRGIQIPQYELVNLHDATTPVDFTQDMRNRKTVDGTLIFNNGNIHTRGYYIWVKDQWHLVMYKGTEPQVLTMTIPENTYLVPANSAAGATNIISGFEEKNSSLDGATVSRNGITLPAGKYSFRYAVDAFAGPQLNMPELNASANKYFNGRLSTHSISTYLRDAATGRAITGTQYSTGMNNLEGAGRFLFYQGLFIFELTRPTTIQQTFQYTDGTSNRTLGIIVRRDYSAVITRMPK